MLWWVFELAKTAKFAYENTVEGSELRRFIDDLIVAEGTFHEKESVESNPSERKKFIDDWILLLAKGGDIVEVCRCWFQ